MGGFQVKAWQIGKRIFHLLHVYHMFKIAHSLSLTLGFFVACACGLCGIERSSAAYAGGETSPAGIIKNAQRSAKSRTSSEISKRQNISESAFNMLLAHCQCAMVQMSDSAFGRAFSQVFESIISTPNEIFTSKLRFDPANPIRAPASIV